MSELWEQIQSETPEERARANQRADRLRAIGAVLVLCNVLAWILFIVTYLVWGQ